VKETPARHLPVQHPDFKYSRSRNPYWTKLNDAIGRVFSDNETEAHRGRWREVFPTLPQELHVEIGCNAGHVILEWAERNPSNAYIGIDWKFKAIHHGFDKALRRKISNVIFFRGYAERVQFMFGPGEIDALYLYFPDPWAKRLQKKNRFITGESLRMLATLVKKGGVFHIKTDHAEYFDWMEEALKETGDTWEVLELTRDLHANHPNPLSLKIPDITLFEGLFLKDGIKINSVKLKRT
jgi:tRNA (guanine-N7-)-methyltransferase